MTVPTTLGLPAALKYERNGKEGRRFDVHAIALGLTAPPAVKERDAFVESGGGWASA